MNYVKNYLKEELFFTLLKKKLSLYKNRNLIINNEKGCNKKSFNPIYILD